MASDEQPVPPSPWGRDEAHLDESSQGEIPADLAVSSAKLAHTISGALDPATQTRKPGWWLGILYDPKRTSTLVGAHDQRRLRRQLQQFVHELECGLPLKHLAPIVVPELLRLLVVAAWGAADVSQVGSRLWFEIEKQVSFTFSALTATATGGTVVADALLPFRPRRGSRASSDRCSAEGPNHCDEDTAAALLVELLRSISASERCVPVITTLKLLIKVRAIRAFLLNTRSVRGVLGVAGTRRLRVPCCAEPPVQTAAFACTFVGRLARHLGSLHTTISFESWGLLKELLLEDPKSSGGLIEHYFSDFVVLLVHSITHHYFVGRLHSLGVVAALLAAPELGVARLHLAESPALFCAILECVDRPSLPAPTTDGWCAPAVFRRRAPAMVESSAASRQIQMYAFHSLKVFIAKRHKPTPLRYLLLINRETLVRYVTAYAAEVDAFADPTSGSGVGQPRGSPANLVNALQQERDLILKGLLDIEPLTHEEALLIGVEGDGGVDLNL